MDDLAKGLGEVRKWWDEWLKRGIAAWVTALGVVVGIAWADAMKSFFEKYFSPANTPMAKLLFALFVTGVLVFATFYVAKRAGVGAKEKEADKPKKDDC